MKVSLIPKTKLGKWSFWLIIVMPILFFVGTSLAKSWYKSVSAGDTILADIVARPALAIAMLLGMVAGVLAFIVGLIAVVRQQERAVLVYISTFIGMLLILFLIGEVLLPH